MRPVVGPRLPITRCHGSPWFGRDVLSAAAAIRPPRGTPASSATWP
jgi:hypothetical protein